jgi:membrane protein required for colicin V production
MNVADWIIVAVVLISCAIGVWRGFMREAISLATWVIGLWLAWTFSSSVEPMLGGLLSGPDVKVWVARLIILVLVVLAGNLVGFIVTKVVRYSPFGPADRMLGLLFGLLRGALLIGIGVILGELLELDGEPGWKESAILPYTEFLGDWVRGLVNEVDIASGWNGPAGQG